MNRTSPSSFCDPDSANGRPTLTVNCLSGCPTVNPAKPMPRGSSPRRLQIRQRDHLGAAGDVVALAELGAHLDGADQPAGVIEHEQGRDKGSDQDGDVVGDAVGAAQKTL